MSHHNFKPTGMWQSTREKEVAAFEEGVKWGLLHGENNHKFLVKENRKLRERIKSLEKSLKTHPLLDSLECAHSNSSCK